MTPTTILALERLSNEAIVIRGLEYELQAERIRRRHQ